ncbi:hypothetical protein BpHYR1_008078 [Brachionus plicatilis]|uniref:Uncharacterized protein n=1 Tax=Brachionus plicatilis TaxID=10195 RepID=A0A3M7RR00_BRAPC|nr:hypothetical protein BpHYR1_008078 [Brachionus plicatilis]
MGRPKSTYNISYLKYQSKLIKYRLMRNESEEESSYDYIEAESSDLSESQDLDKLNQVLVLGGGQNKAATLAARPAAKNLDRRKKKNFYFKKIKFYFKKNETSCSM